MSDKTEARTLASGPGWFVEERICRAGPADRPFEERHQTVAIAAVLGGTFVYRNALGRSLMTPGTLLLGNPGHCFECGHEHGTGDRCLSFHFEPPAWDDVASHVPGPHRGQFAVAGLPPGPAILPMTALAASAPMLEPAVLEEVSLWLAAAALQFAHERASRQPLSAMVDRAIDRQRISDAVRRIEQLAGEIEGEVGVEVRVGVGVGRGLRTGEAPLALASLARDAGLSRYQFLRAFCRQVGMTPHQYVLHQRLQRAAVAIRTTARPIATIALDAGFGDLSTFGRQFRRALGCSPRTWRRQSWARNVRLRATPS